MMWVFHADPTIHFDADPDPDPIFHFDADPDSDRDPNRSFFCWKIMIFKLLFTVKFTLFHLFRQMSNVS
jgi:hypothetical protein